MTTLARFALGLATAIVLASHSRAAETPQIHMPPIHDGSSAPEKAWSAAMEAGDVAALARMHDAASTAFPPDKLQVKGDRLIMTDYAALFARYRVRVATDDVHWIEQGPLVVSWGLTILTLQPKAGGPDIVTKTRFTDAAVRTENGWRYVVDHASIAPQGAAEEHKSGR